MTACSVTDMWMLSKVTIAATSGNLGVAGMIILKWDVQTGFYWLTIGSSGSLL